MGATHNLRLVIGKLRIKSNYFNTRFRVLLTMQIGKIDPIFN